MPSVYVLRDVNGRHYIGCTRDLETRMRQHRCGGTQTTREMQPPLELVAKREYGTMYEALAAERGNNKRWKNGAKVAAWLNGE